MIDTDKLSMRFSVRAMNDLDADEILGLCLENTQYYEYCGKQPSKELILNDLHVTPPGIEPSRKHYIGFFEGGVLMAIMDLIDGYPDSEHCFIGFFMMNRRFQGNNLGSAIIGEVCGYLREAGYKAVMLGIDKDNPQSNHFWKKNGFLVIRQVEQDAGTILVAEKKL